jgi:hypothetical protein
MKSIKIMPLQEILTRYSLLISFLLGAVVGPGASYFQSGQLLTWQGLGAAVIAGVVSWSTTHLGKRQGRVEGFIQGVTVTAPGGPPPIQVPPPPPPEVINPNP